MARDRRGWAFYQLPEGTSVSNEAMILVDLTDHGNNGISALIRWKKNGKASIPPCPSKCPHVPEALFYSYKDGMRIVGMEFMPNLTAMESFLDFGVDAQMPKPLFPPNASDAEIVSGRFAESLIVQLFVVVAFIQYLEWSFIDLNYRNANVDRENWKFVLVDFGSACRIMKPDGTLMETTIESFTPLYSAPEMSLDSYHPKFVDAYAAAVMAVEIWTGVPFHNNVKVPILPVANAEKLRADGLRRLKCKSRAIPSLLVDRMPRMPQALPEFLEKCFSTKPEMRPSWKDIVTNPFISMGIRRHLLNTDLDPHLYWPELGQLLPRV
ncbi:kinase-like protein [Gonapodya prolifera JEL478]|uniref:Kinase-like protein n=1 Tax=Gonapodya prolifera (strain JEL478) TaxID=1344416 RepID=A0A139AB17_GONPJ|nr:kinase-like protein [Gonapodya prolifera JEL478]|eukprot:KXS13940.1 kinase-like protein [Gonapodya prolifera JEL478]